MSEVAKLHRERLRKEFKERRAVVKTEDAEDGKSIRKPQRSYASFKNSMNEKSSMSMHSDALMGHLHPTEEQ